MDTHHPEQSFWPPTGASQQGYWPALRKGIQVF
jgi:hypothetical protein